VQTSAKGRENATDVIAVNSDDIRAVLTVKFGTMRLVNFSPIRGMANYRIRWLEISEQVTIKLSTTYKPIISWRIP
jgi:hypothetical protein